MFEIGLSIGRWFLSKLSLKNVLIAVACGLLSFGVYKLYHHVEELGFQKGVASQAEAINKLTQSVTDLSNKEAAAVQAKAQAESTLADYVKHYNTFVSTAKAAQTDLERTYASQTHALNSQLQGYKRRLAATQEEAENVSRYLPSGVDATCVIVHGFVRLYNGSLSASPGYSADGNADSAATLAADGLPSGIPATYAAGIIAANNAAAVYNRNLVLGWQVWYRGVRAALNAFEAKYPNVIQAPPMESAK